MSQVCTVVLAVLFEYLIITDIGQNLKHFDSLTCDGSWSWPDIIQQIKRPSIRSV